MPAELIERMNREIERVLGLPAVADVIRGLGAESTPMSPKAYLDLIKADATRYATIIQERRITQDRAP